MAAKEKEASEKTSAGDDDNLSSDEGGAGGKKKKIIIIALAALILLLGGGGVAYFLGVFSGGAESESASGEESAASAEENASAEEAAKEESGHGGGKEGKDGKKEGKAHIPGQPYYFMFPEFLVNLNTGSSQPSFLKMRISIELTKAEDVPLVEANLPKVQDSFNTYLREMRASDLAGSAGVYRLKEELLLRLNQSLAPVVVKDILFNEILVQ